MAQESNPFLRNFLSFRKTRKIHFYLSRFPRFVTAEKFWFIGQDQKKKKSKLRMKNGIRFTTFCQFCRSTRDDYGVLKGNLSVMTVLSAISNVRFCLALKNAFDSTSTHKRNFKKCLEICFAKKKMWTLAHMWDGIKNKIKGHWNGKHANERKSAAL